MYLETLVIENIRGFRTGSSPIRLDFGRPDGSYSGLTVIAGRNGSGKSTLLRAIALAIAGPSTARTLMPGYSGWISEGESTARVEAAFSQGADDAFGSGGAPPKSRPWAGLQWTSDFPGALAEMEESIPKSSAKLTARRGPWLENPNGWFLAGYGPFRRLNGAAAEAQRSMLGSKRTAALVTLFDESASLAESTWWMQELYPKQLEGDATSKRINEDVQRMLNDGLLPDGTTVTRYTSDGLWVEQGGAEVVLEEMSDGYRVVAALVIDILRRLYAFYGRLVILEDNEGGVYCPHEGVVLIDEVDVHLHVGWQQRIGFWLRDHFPKIQFIVSTHSPFVAQAASANGLLRLPAPTDASRVPNFLEEPLFSEIVNGDADRVSMSHLFGLESTYSDETLERRRRWSDMEDEEMGSVPSDDLRELRASLGISPSDDVERALRSLDETLRAEDA